jgi:hypothetical protein
MVDILHQVEEDLGEVLKQRESLLKGVDLGLLPLRMILLAQHSIIQVVVVVVLMDWELQLYSVAPVAPVSSS